MLVFLSLRLSAVESSVYKHTNSNTTVSIFQALRPFLEMEVEALLNALRIVDSSVESIGDWDLKFLLSSYNK